MNQKKNIIIGIYSSSTPIISIFTEKAQRVKKLFNQHNFEIIYGDLAFSRDRYRTGSSKERANEINQLISNDKIDILMPSIGGTNTSSILEYLDYKKIKNSKIKIIGHSDTTALILAIYAKTNKITYYGASYILGFDNQDEINNFHFDSLEENCLNDHLGVIKIPETFTDEFIPWENKCTVPNKKMTKNKIVTINPGIVQGILIGGNLDTFLPLIGTPYFPKINKDTILFFEDTAQNDNLSLAQAERNLASLRNSGILHQIKGLIIGKYEGFEKISNGVKYVDFIQEFIEDLKIPILAEYDLSHTLPIVTIAIGSTIELDSTNKKITRLK